MDMGPMSNYDVYRQADIRKYQSKLADPKLPDWEKKKIERALYAIREQRGFKSINNMRERLDTALRQGDTPKAEKIAEEAQKIDRNYV